MNRALLPTWLIAFCCALFAPQAYGESSKQQAADQAALDQLVRPFLKQHCQGCHGGDSPKADLSIEKLAKTATVTDDYDRWESIAAAIRSGEMPPDDRPRPDDQQSMDVLSWIDRALNNLNCDAPHPGHVTIRRLNRIEYENTIRDLLGVRFDAKAHFPADDTGYGFDNIGDVLTTSPLLMEKHIAAAQQIAEKAILAPEMVREPAVLYKAGKLDGGQPASSDSRILTSSGEIGEKHYFKQAGAYIVRVTAAGDQAGDEPVRMGLSIDGRPVAEFDVHAERSEPEMFLARVKIDKGNRQIAASFRNDYYNPKDPDPKKRGDRNLLVYLLEIVGPLEPALAAAPQSHKKILIAEPTDKEWQEAATKILRRFVQRAYRRRVDDEEVKLLTNIVGQVLEDGESFERGIQLAIQATLLSPSFLFRFEGEEERSETAEPINEFALASRLSYFLWSSMPDDELFRLAAQNKLRQELPAQVKRMLADEKADALVENFGGQWLETRLLETAEPDPERFPEFDDALRAAMREESTQFLASMMRENRPVTELLETNYTFLNERLARHYGIDGVRGDKFRRVDLPDNRRGGILTMASVLTVTSHSTRTSPVKRGKWILDQVLGEPPPPPAPDVPELDESPEAKLTGSLRERFEQHRADKSCAACHQKIDPLGFALENYDAIGRWRDKDGKFDIDPSGVLPDGAKLSGPADLKRVLARRVENFRGALVEKMLTYALGRGLEYYDRCAIEEISQRMAADKNRFGSLILGIVLSEPFQLRGGGSE